MKDKVMKIAHSIKETLFDMIRQDEQVIGYLKGKHKIIFEITIKKEKINIDVFGT